MEINSEKNILTQEPLTNTSEASATGLEAQTAEKLKAKPRNLWKDALRRLMRNKLALIGAFFILLILVCAIFAPLIAPYSYEFQDYDHTAELPSGQFIMGTDQLGRDIFSRVVYGAQVSFVIGFVSQIIALAVGIPIGMISGFFGGKTDIFLMRFVDVVYAFPTLLFVILLMSMLGPGVVNIFIALGLTTWVTLARLVRGEFLKLRERDFIVAAHAVGAKSNRIIIRHMLPNTLTPIIVAFTFGIPTAIFTEATLSFIGVGISPPTPSWGQMVSEGYQSIRSLWHLAVFPIIAIALTMFGFSFFGDGLRDALDPTGSEQGKKSA